MARRRGIRWHLFQVQLISVLPIGLLAAVFLYLNWSAQDRERQRSQIESVRLLAVAVDNALDSSVERLSIVARLWSSSTLSEEGVYEQAKLALGGNADWADVVAYDARGRGVFRTTAPFGTQIGELRSDVWKRVFAQAEPVVTDTYVSMHDGQPRPSVGVPVMRGKRVAYVLIARLEPRWYDDLLAKQGQAKGAVAGLFDRNFKFVARSVEGVARRGQDPTPALIRDMKDRTEGLARYVNLNSTPVYTAWTFTRHGWGVAYAIPSGPVDAAFWYHLLVFSFLWAAAVAGGMLYALAKGRSIAATLELVEDQAEHFATGRRIEKLPESSVEEVNRALVALEDASALLQAATQERDRSLETEREARAAAEAANQAKDEFLAMLGHELRNPLAAIATAATIVKTEGRTESQLEFAADVIGRQSQNLKRLIDDLLDVGRAMTGKIVLERAPVDLAVVAHHVIAMLRSSHRLEERNLELDIAPVWVDGDRTRLEQVLTNLLANAVRYTDPGDAIRIRVAREAGEAVVQVSDQGRGIAPEDLPHVFELFFQAETGADRATGGLGVGLTLVQRLVHLHGGEVIAQSDGRSKGATFTVRLPAIAAPKGVHHRPEPTRRGQGETILVVDDESDVR